MKQLKLEQISWENLLSFIFIHVVAVWGFFRFPLTQELFALCIFIYVIRTLGVTAGYHRYFSHRSYKLNRFWQFVLAFIGTTAAHNGPLWWASKHRKHHVHSDTPLDPHSPKHGFWHSHLFWIFTKKNNETEWEFVKDWEKFPELKFLNKAKELGPFSLMLLLYLWGGGPFLIWGFFINTLFVWHLAFLNNSLAHTWGYRNYSTEDDSRNNLFLGFINLGEGWHNNHHRYPQQARCSFQWWELDLTYVILKFLAMIGIVRELKLKESQN